MARRASREKNLQVKNTRPSFVFKIYLARPSYLNTNTDGATTGRMPKLARDNAALRLLTYALAYRPRVGVGEGAATSGLPSTAPSTSPVTAST